MKIKTLSAFVLISIISFLGIQNIQAQMPAEWPPEFIGVWKVKREGHDPRYIVLRQDATCKTTFNIATKGKWQYDPDQKETRINWEDGWTDILLKQNGVYKNYGYSPSEGPGDKAKTKFNAVKVDLNPFNYLGVWRVSAKDGRAHSLTINADGTASTDKDGGQKGDWEISGKKVSISWSGGGKGFLVKVKTGVYKYEVSSKTVKGGEPSAVYTATRVKAFVKDGILATVISSKEEE